MDNSLEFQKVCSFKELKSNAGMRFLINDVDVAIFLIEDKIYAVDNVCPHKQSALIYDGFIEGQYIVCPAHGWKFNLITGRTDTGGKGLNVYETKIENGDVYIKIFERKFFW